MLDLFEVNGFKNFKHTVKLDFSDTRDYAFNTDCILDQRIGKCIIYGQNAVGKTNFGLALFDIVSHLSNKHMPYDLYDYYLNTENTLGYAQFHYVFSFQNHVIDYLYRKNEKQSLLYEKVILNGKLLFEYDYIAKENTRLDGIKELTSTLNWTFVETDCILKYIVNNTMLDKDHPLRQMMRFVSHMLWFRNLEQSRYIGYKTKSDDYFDFIFTPDVLKEFEAFLHDSGIQDNLTIKTNADGRKHLYFDTNPPLPFFKTASNGTRALYSFFYWYKTANDVSLMFLDEFDAFYHYELAESIVTILEKMKHTQVIMSSHNTNLLTNRIMRPDCYFILTKEGLTSFANATTRELREGHNLEKLYMGGEFNGQSQE